MKLNDVLVKIQGKLGENSLTKSQIRSVIDAYADIIIDTMATEDFVPLRDIGRFKGVKRVERTYTSNLSPKPTTVPAHTTFTFKPSKAFKVIK